MSAKEKDMSEREKKMLSNLIELFMKLDPFDQGRAIGRMEEMASKEEKHEK